MAKKHRKQTEAAKFLNQPEGGSEAEDVSESESAEVEASEEVSEASPEVSQPAKQEQKIAGEEEIPAKFRKFQ